MTTLTEQRRDLVKSAQDIINAAQKAGRELSQDELDQLKSKNEQIDRLNERIERHHKSQRTMDRLSALGGDGMTAADLDADADGFDPEYVKQGLHSALRKKSNYGFNLPRKAMLSTELALPTLGQNASDVPLGTAAVALADLMQPQLATGPVVRYYRMGAGSAAVVPEGELKPDAGISVEPVDASLSKIATTFGFSDELSEDAGWLIDHIRREALRAVLVRENALIVTELDDAEGVLASTGAKAQAIDVLAGAIAATQATNGQTPTNIVANPLDVAEIRISKAESSGTYHVDPLGAGPSTVHGVPLLASPAVAPGRLYLLSEGFGAFYRRSNGIRVEVGYTGDDFQRNTATARVEERVLPAVIRPQLLTRVTLTDD